MFCIYNTKTQQYLGTDWTDDINKVRTYKRLSDAKNSANCCGWRGSPNIIVLPLQVSPKFEKSETEGRVDWTTYFLTLAKLVSRRSHDVHTQHGCVITDASHRILGTGYNGFPRKMLSEAQLPLTRPEKYAWMIHSEVNAVSNCVHRPEDGIAYVTGHPCNNCIMHLWQNGVNTVYFANSHGSKLLDDKTKEIFDEFIRQSQMKVHVIDVDYSWAKEIFND